MVSTGGEAGTFTCTSAAGMESFIARYASPHLVGIDFDIEGGQSASDIQNLVAAAAGAQAQYPEPAVLVHARHAGEHPTAATAE